MCTILDNKNDFDIVRISRTLYIDKKSLSFYRATLCIARFVSSGHSGVQPSVRYIRVLYTSGVTKFQGSPF